MLLINHMPGCQVLQAPFTVRALAGVSLCLLAGRTRLLER